ncbi:hypothetical protein DFH06DRAFT_1348014 [Mycena polygramma]|nr:hypothetical protein DFH06DRAFT_1348014 [Mycena polygramma]
MAATTTATASAAVAAVPSSALRPEPASSASPSSAFTPAHSIAYNAAPSSVTQPGQPERRAVTAERRASYNAVERIQRESLNRRFMVRFCVSVPPCRSCPPRAPCHFVFYIPGEPSFATRLSFPPSQWRPSLRGPSITSSSVLRYPPSCRLPIAFPLFLCVFRFIPTFLSLIISPHPPLSTSFFTFTFISPNPPLTLSFFHSLPPFYHASHYSMPPSLLLPLSPSRLIYPLHDTKLITLPPDARLDATPARHNSPAK